MADITVVSLSSAGVNPAPVSCNGGGDAALNLRGRTCIRVRNAGVASQTVTVTAQQTARPADGIFPPMTVPNIAVAVPNGEQRIIGPFPLAYNDAAGKVQITYGGVTSLTIEAFEHP